MIRQRVEVRGEVQGVGFRPGAVRLARHRGVAGFVRNGPEGVEVEVEGPEDAVAAFLADLPGVVVAREARPVEGAVGFVIRPSAAGEGTPAGLVPPDRPTCAACRAELSDPTSRRFRYAFTSCPDCGPRATVARSTPLDRARTAMDRFPPCAACAAELGDPDDRRFHAQITACPACGPRLVFDGVVEGALDAAGAALRAGRVVAVKGDGGFQLLCDATDPAAVARLRAIKRRPHRPLAVLTDQPLHPLLADPARPVVLLEAPPGAVAAGVAPGLDRVGWMAPATPLHLLLLASVGRPLVCTSGNAAGGVLARSAGALGLVPDHVLDHDRDIVRRLDDPVVRPSPRGPIWLRRGRGQVPRPLAISDGPTVLAVGGHFKGAVAAMVGPRLRMGGHVGDLTTRAAEARLREEVGHVLAGAAPVAVACDRHPDYASTRLAEDLAARWGVPLLRIGHHHAHAAAVMLEHGLDRSVALTWDGVGLGDDDTAWGGEALVVDGARSRRLAALRPIPLAGGDAAARAPRRLGLALLDAVGHAPDDRLLALVRSPRTPRTSSVGRLFDGVAWLLGLAPDRTTWDAQAALALERAAAAAPDAPGAYPLSGGDWRPLVTALLDDPAPVAVRARRFHRALAGFAAEAVGLAPEVPVVLAGGCFQNAVLLDDCASALEARGRAVHWAAALPANDGALAAGQAWIARRLLDA